MISGLQIKAARALLKLSATELAAKSGVSLSTVKRFEQFDGEPAVNMRTLSAVRDALQKSGIEFLGTPDENPGVRLSTK